MSIVGLGIGVAGVVVALMWLFDMELVPAIIVAILLTGGIHEAPKVLHNLVPPTHQTDNYHNGWSDQK